MRRRDIVLAFALLIDQSVAWRPWWDSCHLSDGERRWYVRWLWFSVSVIAHPPR